MIALCYYRHMFLTPHTSVAVWLSIKTEDPVLAFFLGLVSHFILDIIPHGDETLGSHKLTKRGKFFYLMKTATVDVILSAIFIYFYIMKHPNFNRPVLGAAVLGAWLPDLAWLAIENFKIAGLYWYVVWHGRIHNVFNWRYSPAYGVPFQIMVTLLMVRLTF